MILGLPSVSRPRLIYTTYMKYVALLRGINAGGNRRVPMTELRELFTQMGFQNVVTYINSGNVVFDSSDVPSKEQIMQTLTKTFGFDIDTLVLNSEQIEAIADDIPDAWQNNRDEQKSDVLYLFDNVNSPKILEDIGYRPDIETLIYTNHAILSNVSRQNQSRSSLQKIIGTPLYRRVTVRNVNTTRKLAELVRQD